LGEEQIILATWEKGNGGILNLECSERLVDVTVPDKKTEVVDVVIVI
jgi:hypothetical protein